MFETGSSSSSDSGSNVKRRPSSSNAFKEGSSLKMPDRVSTTGADWQLDMIPSSEGNTPGYELANNPLEAAAAAPSAQGPRTVHKYSSSSGSTENLVEKESPGALNEKQGSAGSGPASNVYVEEHELVFNPHEHDNARTRENTGQPDSEEFDTEEYQRLFEASRLNWRDPPMNKYRIIACCIWTFTAGLSDAAPGALIPTMEEYYNISYAVVSMIWMSCAIGYIIVALSTPLIGRVVPKHYMTSVGIVFQILAYAIISTGTKFIGICVAFFSNGMGLALGLTQYNVFLSSFTNASTCLALMHGFYGVGALVAPLVAQSMLNKGYSWNRYYFILLGFSIFNFFNVYITYRNTPTDLAKYEEADAHRMEMEQLQIQHEKGDSYRKISDFLDSIRDYRTWLLCGFVFFYQGGEVSLGGWMVTFLLDERHGDPSATGYVASGYWGGLTLGRFILTTYMHAHLGGRRSILVLTETIAALVLISWLVPNLYISAVCGAISGVFIGPIYPLMIALVSHPKILPRKILTQSLLIMTSMGSSGGAILPLVVGLISDHTGTWVLFPIVLILFHLMILCWLLLPNVENTTGQSFWRKYIW